MTQMNDTKTHKHLQWFPEMDEQHFSWSPCDCCGSRLGGDRWDAKCFGVNLKTEKFEEVDSGSICIDCVMDGA